MKKPTLSKSKLLIAYYWDLITNQFHWKTDDAKMNSPKPIDYIRTVFKKKETPIFNTN